MIKIKTKEFNELVAKKIAEKNLNAANSCDIYKAEKMVADDLNHFSKDAIFMGATSLILSKGARIVKIHWYYSESKEQDYKDLRNQEHAFKVDMNARKEIPEVNVLEIEQFDVTPAKPVVTPKKKKSLPPVVWSIFKKL